MGFYEKHCLPHVINCACGIRPIQRQRQKVVPQARGRVLEVGMGSGLNLPFYNAADVEFVWGLEPSEGMRETLGAAGRDYAQGWSASRLARRMQEFYQQVVAARGLREDRMAPLGAATRAQPH